MTEQKHIINLELKTTLLSFLKIRLIHSQFVIILVISKISSFSHHLFVFFYFFIATINFNVFRLNLKTKKVINVLSNIVEHTGRFATKHYSQKSKNICWEFSFILLASCASSRLLIIKELRLYWDPLYKQANGKQVNTYRTCFLLSELRHILVSSRSSSSHPGLCILATEAALRKWSSK